MAALVSALHLLEPTMVVNSPPSRENRCYMMRIGEVIGNCFLEAFG
jgi:hypothetical protein